MPTPEEELAAASETIGPKRVKTPNMEVEQFDPLVIQRAVERQSSTYPVFGNFGMTVVSPDTCKYGRKQ